MILAHAPNPQSRSDAASRHELSAATGALRRLHRGIHHRTTARGARHEAARRSLCRFRAPLSRPARHRISAARPRRARHRVRAHLHAPQENQHLNRFGGGKNSASRKSTKASGSSPSYDLGYIDLEQKTLQPPGVSWDNPFGPRVSPKSQVHSVTHVSGLDTLILWRARRDSNSRPPDS